MLTGQTVREQPSPSIPGGDILVVTSHVTSGFPGRVYIVRVISYDDFYAMTREYSNNVLTAKEELYENYLAQTMWVGSLPKAVELVFNGPEGLDGQKVFDFDEGDDLGFLRPDLVRKLNDIDKMSRPCIFAVMESHSHRATISSRLFLQQNRRYKVDMELRLCPRSSQKEEEEEEEAIFRFGYNFQLLDEAAHVVQVNLHHLASRIWEEQLQQPNPFDEFTENESFAEEMIDWMFTATGGSCETFKLDVSGQGTDYYTQNVVAKRALDPALGTRPREGRGGAKRRRIKT